MAKNRQKRATFSGRLCIFACFQISKKKILHLVEHRKVSVRGKFSHRFEHSRIFSHPQTFLFFRKNEFSPPRICLIWHIHSGKKILEKVFPKFFHGVFRHDLTVFCCPVTRYLEINMHLQNHFQEKMVKKFFFRKILEKFLENVF